MTRKPTAKKTTTGSATEESVSAAVEPQAPVAAEELYKASLTSAPLTDDAVADAPSDEDATDEASLLRKPEFINRVVERSGGKKKDVKPAVEAALAILAEAIVAGEAINLPPLGKLKVVRTRETPNADVTTFRLRRSRNMVEAQSTDQSGDEKTV